jgi:hypothetical protein
MRIESRRVLHQPVGPAGSEQISLLEEIEELIGRLIPDSVKRLSRGAGSATGGAGSPASA